MTSPRNWLSKPQRSPKHQPDANPTIAPSKPAYEDFKPQRVITLHPDSALAKQFQAAQAKITGGLH